MEGCCRKCLRGTPSGYNLQKNFIKHPYLRDSVINMKSEEKPCKYPGNCDLKCVLCFSLIINSDDVELDIWPGFKVHKACTRL